VIDCLIKIVIAYLLGSLSGSLLVGKLRGVDIRTQGSGNAGGTNAFRTQGLAFALAVVIIDVGKGALAAGVVPFLPLPFLEARDAVSAEVTAATCGIAAVLGHMLPIFFGFRGGKGAATYIGALAVILPIAIAPALGVWVLVLITTGYVGLATISTAVAMVPLAWWLTPAARLPVVVGFALLAGALIVYAHRSNVRRLLAGNENRFDKARIGYWLSRR